MKCEGVRDRYQNQEPEGAVKVYVAEVWGSSQGRAFSMTMVHDEDNLGKFKGLV